MKAFNRFTHNGVKAHLERLRSNVAKLGSYEFGSSGEGELTIRSPRATAYARKYRIKNGWRLTVCHGSNRIFEKRDIASPEFIVDVVASML